MLSLPPKNTAMSFYYGLGQLRSTGANIEVYPTMDFIIIEVFPREDWMLFESCCYLTNLSLEASSFALSGGAREGWGSCLTIVDFDGVAGIS